MERKRERKKEWDVEIERRKKRKIVEEKRDF